jgi:phenylalanine-4-hydroxylase
VEEMNQALDRVGWRAVVVNGFIPPAAFMEFQAHRILVISAEMRTIEHILYTPAPDIVHEAAGHAPIIADEMYAKYLQKFGEYGSKAMASKNDFDVYEAIRHLSIIKEYPDTSEDKIKKAEEDLNEKIAANKNPSEAARLSRLHWWTVEYGLIGSPKNFKQYGAGLLSSVGESEYCLKPEVQKIPLSVHCTDYNYDITTMQPQLFVASDWQHLIDVLEEFASTMCFRTGGLEAIQMARDSENVATLEYSSGIQVSGILSDIKISDQGNIAYLQFTGPSALAFQNRQIQGHGVETHAAGFGSPVGKLTNSNKPLELFENSDFEKHNIIPNKRSRLVFESGIVVDGIVEKIQHNNEINQIISFKDCLINDPNGDILFKPEWGTYDMAVGENIVSVFSGTADKENYNVLPAKSDEIAITINYSDRDKHLFTLYQFVEDMKKSDSIDLNKLVILITEIVENYPDEWLIHLEILELIPDNAEGLRLKTICLNHLEKLKSNSDENQNLISEGLKLISINHKDHKE